MSEINEKVWALDGNEYYLTPDNKKIPKLDNAIYNVHLTPFGTFKLVKTLDFFNFDYKIYGLESDLINRVVKTYNYYNYGNLGILLNGLKGSGKTVTSKIIANQLNQPVIIVDSNLDNISNFLNEIPQNITIFIDEYEKIFGQSSEMLTIMDGVLNSKYRRVFILTTNDLHVEKNLIERPSRIRYLKKFENLDPKIVEEIVDDVLINKDFKADCIKFISSLETITVDIVKTVLSEVNIHNEPPTMFENVFNVKKIRESFNITVLNENQEFSVFGVNIDVYPSPKYNSDTIGRRLRVDSVYIGTITRVINRNTVEVTPNIDSKTKKPIGFNDPLILKIEYADTVNDTFAYNEYGVKMATPTDKYKSTLLSSILIEVDNDEDDF